MRAAFNLGNPTLVRRNGDALVGVAVDIARRLAEGLGLRYEPLACDSPASVLRAVRGSDAEIGFIALDPSRSEGLLCTPPYLLVEANYAVSTEVGPSESAQVDAEGVRVGVTAGTAFEAFLRRNLRRAHVVPAATQDEALDALRAGHIDVVAGIRSPLEEAVEAMEDLVVLPDRFMAIEQGVALTAAHGNEALSAIANLLQDFKATGFIQQSLADHGITGAIVA